jgi:hypothetical protein
MFIFDDAATRKLNSVPPLKSLKMTVPDGFNYAREYRRSPLYSNGPFYFVAHASFGPAGGESEISTVSSFSPTLP